MLNDYGKLIIFGLCIVGSIVLMSLHAIGQTEGVGIIMTIIGYVTGNGRLAVRGERPSTLVSPRDDRRTPAELPPPKVKDN